MTVTIYHNPACVIMVFAFAPLVALLLGLSSITVPWETLILSGA